MNTQKEQTQRQIDLVDLCGRLIRRWYLIFAAMLVCAVLFSVFMSRKSAVQFEEEETMSRKVSDARSHLTPAQVTDIDNLFHEYCVYINYKRSMLDKYTQYVMGVDQLEGSSVLKANYLLETDVIDAFNLLDGMILSEEDYQKIADVTGHASGFFDETNRVRFVEPSGNRVYDGAGRTYKDSFSMIVVGDDTDQCARIAEIADKAITRRCEEYQEKGMSVQTTLLGTNDALTPQEAVFTIQQQYVDRMTKAENTVWNLETYYINILEGYEKSYFDLLKEQYENRQYHISEQTRKKEESETEAADGNGIRSVSKKNILIGALLGLVLAVMGLVALYIFGETVNSNSEIEGLLQLPVLDTWYIANRKTPVRALIIWLRRIIPMQKQNSFDRIAAHLTLIAKRKGCSSLYLFHEKQDEMQEELSSYLAGALKEQGIKVEAGNPAADGADLLKFADGEKTVLLLTQLKKSQKQYLKKAACLCEQFEQNMLGVLTIENC